MDLFKIFHRIILALSFIAGTALLIVLFLEPIPPNVRNNVIWIVLISLICAILLWLLFLVPFGFGNIKDLTNFTQGLKDLKREDVQKSLSELKELPNVAKILRMAIINKLKIVEDYNKYLQLKKVKSMWVIGASLRNTEPIKLALEKGIRCEYLCVGDKTAIEHHAQRIVSCLGEKSHEYIINKAIEIYCIGSHPVQFPRTFYNPGEADAEVLIFFPDEIENILGKYAILLEHNDVIQKWVEEYISIKKQYKDTGDILTKFVTQKA